MSSNKDFLRLENEFRHEIPKYKEKPKIVHIEKPASLTKKVSDFLNHGHQSKLPSASENDSNSGKEDAAEGAQVEMDILITSM